MTDYIEFLFLCHLYCPS